MDLKHDHDEDTNYGFERLRKFEEIMDFLSGMPEEILVHILSFLPIKDAVKTALNRSFGNLWRSVRILDFDQCSHHSCYNGPYCSEKFINLIHQVAKLNESRTLDKLRLKFAFHKDYDSVLAEDSADDEDQVMKSTANKITSMVHYAINKKVKVLDLDLLGCGFFELIEDYTVPDVVFTSDLLIELRLAFCDIKFLGEISLKSLKVLALNEIELNDKHMEKILLGCPSLEDLTLIGCSSLRKLNCSKNRNLKKLNLVLHMGKTLMISCPSVESLKIDGCVERVKLLDLPSVMDNSLFISSRSRCENKVY